MALLSGLFDASGKLPAAGGRSPTRIELRYGLQGSAHLKLVLGAGEQHTKLGASEVLLTAIGVVASLQRHA